MIADAARIARLLKEDGGFLLTEGGDRILLEEDQGYHLTGFDAAFTLANALTATGGSYAVTGNAATLAHNTGITAAGGAYTLTGQATSGATTTPITADKGSYALTGLAATLTNPGAAGGNSSWLTDARRRGQR